MLSTYPRQSPSRSRRSPTALLVHAWSDHVRPRGPFTRSRLERSAVARTGSGERLRATFHRHQACQRHSAAHGRDAYGADAGIEWNKTGGFTP